MSAFCPSSSVTKLWMFESGRQCAFWTRRRDAISAPNSRVRASQSVELLSLIFTAPAQIVHIAVGVACVSRHPNNRRIHMSLSYESLPAGLLELKAMLSRRLTAPLPASYEERLSLLETHLRE